MLGKLVNKMATENIFGSIVNLQLSLLNDIKGFHCQSFEGYRRRLIRRIVTSSVVVTAAYRDRLAPLVTGCT